MIGKGTTIITLVQIMTTIITMIMGNICMVNTNPFLNTSHIIPFDFYDELLVKYYGKYHEYVDIDYEAGCKVKVVVYVWDGKYYLNKVEVLG